MSGRSNVALPLRAGLASRCPVDAVCQRHADRGSRLKRWTGTYSTQQPLAPAFAFDLTVRADGPDAVRYEATFAHPEGIPTQQLALQFSLPVYLYSHPADVREEVFTPGPEPFTGP